MGQMGGGPMPVSAAASLALFAGTLVFWSSALLHLLRLSSPRAALRGRDASTDLAQVLMGTAMAYGIFPTAPSASARPLAVLFAGLGLGFAARAARTRASCHRPYGRTSDGVQAVGNLAMALMQRPGAPPSPGQSRLLAALLLLAAGYYAATAYRMRAARCGVAERTHARLLIFAPHASMAATSLGMAAMAAAGR